MAKDVDLSSREWLDIVFEGKNKDFGAYELRNESAKRHNKSVIFTLIGIILVAALAWGWSKYNTYMTEKRLAEEKARQEALAKQMEKELEEELEEEPEYIEPEKEEVVQEDIQNSQKVTELNIVADELVKEPPKTQEQLKEDERQVGAVDEDKGTNDITKDVVKVEQIVVPEVKPKEEKKEEPKPEPKPKEEEVFKSAAHMPSFPGGDAALMSHINKNIRYPQVAQDNGVQGKVIVQFVVEKDGRVGEVKVARGVDKDLDREAVRVCKTLPKFSPGRNAVGDPVRVWYTLPITFKLQGVN